MNTRAFLESRLKVTTEFCDKARTVMDTNQKAYFDYTDARDTLHRLGDREIILETILNGKPNDDLDPTPTIPLWRVMYEVLESSPMWLRVCDLEAGLKELGFETSRSAIDSAIRTHKKVFAVHGGKRKGVYIKSVTMEDDDYTPRSDKIIVIPKKVIDRFIVSSAMQAGFTDTAEMMFFMWVSRMGVVRALAMARAFEMKIGDKAIEFAKSKEIEAK